MNSSLDTIIISDLEVLYHVGVPDQERAKPQCLHLTIEMRMDFRIAAASEDVHHTVDYYEVSRRLLRFGDGKSWKLIETLASDIAAMILKDFKPESVSVEVKKFILPEARYVAVRVVRSATGRVPTRDHDGLQAAAE